jgi:hypothetical protein
MLEGMNTFRRPENAIESVVFPRNPVPFALPIGELRKGNTDAIRSPEVQRCLWILMGQSYGQLASINLISEYERLTGPVPCLI